jgi:hypothetical protein
MTREVSPPMGRQLGAIAWNTFRAAIRSRVLHGIVVLAAALVLSSLAVGQLSVDNDARVIRDMGTSFISLTVVAVAIFSGVSLLQAEVQRKTIYTIVTKPVSRGLFIFGKFLGLALTLLVIEAVLGGVLLLLVAVRGDPFGVVLIQSLLLSLGEGLVVAAIATFFSSFSTPVTSGVVTFGLFVLGRLWEALHRYAETAGGEALRLVMPVAEILLPDLTLGRADLEVAYLIPLHWSYVGYAAGYDLCYAGVALLLASLIFARRDFV